MIRKIFKKSIKVLSVFVIYKYKKHKRTTMSKITRAEAISLISQAINLAGDGGSSPFTKEEYDAMYDLLDELEKEVKPKRSHDDWS